MSAIRNYKYCNLEETEMKSNLRQK